MKLKFAHRKNDESEFNDAPKQAGILFPRFFFQG